MEKLVISRKSYFSAGTNSQHSSFGEGSNYCLEAFVEGPVDPVSGLIANLTDIDQVLKDYTQPLDHKNLNQDITKFGQSPVTPGDLAKDAFHEMKDFIEKLHNVKLISTKVYQGEYIFAEYHCHI